MNLICIPFAHVNNMNSGVNVHSDSTSKDTIMGVYLKNAAVALISAKEYNADCDIAFATNLSKAELPTEFITLLEQWKIKVLEIPFDAFRFRAEYKWALAFYKLCVLKKLAQMDYEAIAYLDTDVFIQGSFDAIWQECEQNIMLYDINHGLGTPNYRIICDEFAAFCGQRQLITHYGGEFFAASSANAKLFAEVCERIYDKMQNEHFETTMGDEFILSLAAAELKPKIKNAGAYIYRFWTSPGFRLVSGCYRFNRVTILHVPNEKQRGMLKMYNQYISKGIVPKDGTVWCIFRLEKLPMTDRIKACARNLLKKVRA